MGSEVEHAKAVPRRHLHEDPLCRTVGIGFDGHRPHAVIEFMLPCDAFRGEVDGRKPTGPHRTGDHKFAVGGGVDVVQTALGWDRLFHFELDGVDDVEVVAGAVGDIDERGLGGRRQRRERKREARTHQHEAQILHGSKLLLGGSSRERGRVRASHPKLKVGETPIAGKAGPMTLCVEPRWCDNGNRRLKVGVGHRTAGWPREETMKYLLSSAIVALALSASYSAGAAEITLIAPGGIRAAVEQMIPAFEKKTGHKVKATFGSGNGTKAQIAKGDPFDVPIVQPPYPEVLASGNVVAASETRLAHVAVGVAVRPATPHPDISSPEAVKKMLLSAKSIFPPRPDGGAPARASLAGAAKKLWI